MKKLLIIFYAISFSALTLFANLDDELVRASSYGNTARIKSLLAKGADPKAQDSRALVYAAEENYTDSFNLLLKAGADPSQALISASLFGYVSAIKLLLQSGADPKAQDSQALISASLFGHVSAIKLLLQSGSDPKAQDSLALGYAVDSGNFETVQLLLEAGADPKAQDSNVLAKAAKKNNTDSFNLLLKAGADPSQALISASLFGDVSSLKWLLEAGANPKAQDSKALIRAVAIRNIEVVRLLLQAGANPKAQDSQALITAANRNYTEIIKLLVEAGADPSEALINIVYGGSISSIKLLLEVGADPKVQDSQVLISAAFIGNIEVVQLLLKAGADPKAQDSKALINAVSLGHVEIVKLLLKAGADPKAQDSGALIVAEATGHIEIVKLLLKAGADPKAQDSRALIAAAEEGHIEIVKLLLKAGADPKAQDSGALIVAAATGHIEIVRLLLKAGADPKAQDSGALIAAAEEGHIEIVSLLRKLGAGLSPSTLALAEAVSFVKKNDLEGFIAMHHSGKFDISDPTSMKTIFFVLSFVNYDFVKYIFDNIPESVQPFLATHGDSALIKAAMEGHIDVVRLFLEKGANPNAEDTRALIYAFLEGHTDIVTLLLEYGADPFGLKVAESIQFMKNEDLNGFISMCKSGELDLSHPIILKEILLSRKYAFVKYAFENVEELKNAYLIGFNNFYGQWSANVLKVITDKDKSNKNAYLVDISLEIAQDEDIMQLFSGFINPGAGDSYPSHENPFTIAELKEDNLLEHEKVYQQVITMAKKYDIPYLGVCAGAQHLVLNGQGSLKKGGHNGTIKVNFIPGTIPHYLFLTPEEKSEALSDCKVDAIELTDASTAHSYAGYKEDLGSGIKLAAVSETGIPEAYSLGANKIGVQFHPEDYYRDSNYTGLNRHQHFMDGVFGIFEGYYRSMQYAKKMGIDRATAKAAIRKANQELVKHLENCATSGKSKFSNGTLWGKGLDITDTSGVKTVLVMPGISPEDIAITRDEDNNLIVYSKDEQGTLTIVDRFDSADVPEVLRIEFADGSVIEVDPADVHRADMSFSGEKLVSNNK